MIKIGNFGGFEIQWNQRSGAIMIGEQRLTRADGGAEFACSPDEAMTIAYHCVLRDVEAKGCFFHVPNQNQCFAA